MSGTNSELEMITGGPVIVLVEPQLGENIGMVARAMANFGLSELRLVAPRDGWPSDKARAAASKADHVIDGAVVYATLEEALADLNFVYATTARVRDGFKPVRSPIVAAETLRAKYDAGEKVGILFGREKSGLSNEDVALADEVVTFPVNPAFASLNIAQAVLLMSYEWMKTAMVSKEETPFQAVDQAPAPVRAYRGGAGRTRLLPSGREKAENDRQPPRGSLPPRVHCARNQGHARRHLLPRPVQPQASARRRQSGRFR
jgi:tRNA/rRNA methyltransferase